MSFLRRFLPRSEPEHHHSDEPVPGWDAINAALAPIYGETDPLHWGTVIRWRMGGPDPLDGISAYRADGPPTHWHFISYGLSELYWKETDDPAESGWGIELTFRLRREVTDDQPPRWAINLLQNLARYVFESGNVLRAGDHMDLYGPIAPEESTEVRAVAFELDPQLGRIDTPHGSLEFIQILGLTQEEYAATMAWNTKGLVDLIRQLDPLLVTDLTRGSYLADPALAERVRARTAAEGSRMGQINVDRLAWQGDAERLTITMGANAVDRLKRMIEGRLGYGRVMQVHGPDTFIAIEPADPFAWHDAGRGAVHVDLPVAMGRRILAELAPVAGTYEVDERLRMVVERTIVTNQKGQQIDTIG